MPGLDVDQLLSPVSDEAPAGINLEYDPVFSELERTATGEPERQSGNEVIAAKDPNWKDVRRLSLELLPRSKDLRVAVLLVEAETALAGVDGLADSIGLIQGLVDRYWDGFYPPLENDGEYDPIFRINALAPLSDLGGLVGILRKTSLIESKAAGRFTFRDIELAEQKSANAEGVGPSKELLVGALHEAGADYARSRMACLHQAMDALKAIEAGFVEKTKDRSGPDFALLQKTLQGGLTLLAKGIPAEAVASDQEDESGTNLGAGAEGPLRSRADVKRILEQLCDFMQRTEPGNPVPILLRRAQRLLDCSFMDIIQDLVPDALPEIQKLAGAGQAHEAVPPQ